MGVTSYATLDGEIVSENRNGTRRDYLPDPLGSTAALLDSSQQKTDEWTYWPYGEERERLGTTMTPSGYIGTAGYWTDDSSNRIYVQTRTYRPSLARWGSIDGLWPEEPPYAYCSCSPTSWTDPDGLSVKVRKCNSAEHKAEDAKCKAKFPGGKQIVCIVVENTITFVTCFGITTIVQTTVMGTCRRGKTGDCSPWQHKALQDDVNKKCKGADGPRKCTSGMSCDQLRENRKKFAACAGARGRINYQCYRGGDPGHITAFEQAVVGMQNCTAKMVGKC